MPRKASPKRKQAFELWEQSGKKCGLKDIADKLGVSSEQIRKWKSEDKWDSVTLLNTDKTISNVTKSETNEKKVRGAQSGNKNALGNPGGGAPEGNKNNWKHGLYERLLFETLSDGEKELMTDLDISEEKELKLTMRLCDIKVIRLNHLINEAKNKLGGLAVSSVTRTENQSGEKSSHKSTTTNTIATTDLILKYESEIQKYTKQKVRCIESLNKIRQSKEGSKSNSIAEEWIAALLGGEGGGE